MPNVYDAIRIISLNLDEIEFVQHHVWIDLKPNQTEHIKYAGAHTLCIQNRAASMLLCSIYTLFYRHPYIRIQHAHSYLHSPVCKASKTNKGWRHRISVLTWTFYTVAGALLSCTICNLLTRLAHSLSLSHSKMLFVSSCAHQTSLNCVCSGAATWTNSATVNQLVYHWIYTLWLISKLIVIIILFRYFSADTFPNRFHFTIKRRKKIELQQRTDNLRNEKSRTRTHAAKQKDESKVKRVQINIARRNKQIIPNWIKERAMRWKVHSAVFGFTCFTEKQFSLKSSLREIFNILGSFF